jgi:very-short-patch-repair endonuclease
MLNKEAARFLNRKKVKQILQNKVLTDNHIKRLNNFFSIYRCKEVEDMHCTIAKFVLYDLTNYNGRYRRLKGIPGTTKYTQLLRYGKKEFKKVITEQSKRTTKHFKNKIEYWVANGLPPEEAKVVVSKIQTSRSRRSPVTKKGVTEYSIRCVDFWVKRGKTESEAKNIISNLQRRSHSEDRNIRWQNTLKSKSVGEIALINAKKGHSVEAYMLRGMSEHDAIEASILYFKNRNNFSKSSQIFFSFLETFLDGDVYYKSKNYEKQINGKCVDFYHVNSNTVIEYYGDFWHRNPKIYNSEFVAYEKSSLTVWDEDHRRITKIKNNNNVRVIIVWESDVNKNRQKVVEYIIKEIENAD